MCPLRTSPYFRERRSLGKVLDLHKAIERKFVSHAGPNAPCLNSLDETGSQGFQRPYGREGEEREAEGGRAAECLGRLNPGFPDRPSHCRLTRTALRMVGRHEGHIS